MRSIPRALGAIGGMPVAGRLVLLLAFWAALFANAAEADEKPLRGVALVIGNGAYEHLSKLPNPSNDADAIEGVAFRSGV